MSLFEVYSEHHTYTERRSFKLLYALERLVLRAEGIIPLFLFALSISSTGSSIGNSAELPLWKNS